MTAGGEHVIPPGTVMAICGTSIMAADTIRSMRNMSERRWRAPQQPFDLLSVGVAGHVASFCSSAIGAGTRCSRPRPVVAEQDPLWQDLTGQGRVAAPGRIKMRRPSAALFLLDCRGSSQIKSNFVDFTQKSNRRQLYPRYQVLR